MQQMHAGFGEGAPSFVVIAGRAGCDNVLPDVTAIKMARHHVIHRQNGSDLAAILAGVIIAAKDLAPVERHLRVRSMDHVLQADHRWDRISGGGSMHDAASVHHKIGFIGEH